MSAMVLTSIVRFVQDQDNNNNNNEIAPKRYGVAKCLFGSPNPQDITDMLEDEFQKQRLRFLEKWNLDIEEDLNRKRKAEDEENEYGKRTRDSDEKMKRKDSPCVRKVLRQRNDGQLHITDFWSATKINEEHFNSQRSPKSAARRINL